METNMYQELKVKDVIPTPDNPRFLNEADTKQRELVASVGSVGVLQPVLCRPHPTKKDKYDLRCGSRRLAAAIECKLKLIPAIIRDMDDQTALEVTIIENMHRGDLTPFEEARAISMLMASGANVKDLVVKFGRSSRWIHRRAALNGLVKGWNDIALKNDPDIRVPLSVMERLACYPSEIQDRLLKDFEDQCWDFEDIEAFERHMAEKDRLLTAACFNTDACAACHKRSAAQPELFHDTDDPEQICADDRCLDAECWKLKAQTAIAERENELKAKHPNLVRVSKNNGGNDRPEQAGALKSWQYHAAKKTTPGAVPALNVDSGKLEYVTISEGYQADHKKAGAKTMEEKRAELDSKRWCEVLKRLREFVDTSKVEGLCRDHIVFALAAIFGTSAGMGANDWDDYHKLPADMEEIRRQLWVEVQPVLTGMISYNGPITQMPESFYEEAAEVSGLFLQHPLICIKEAVWADPDFAEPKCWLKVDEPVKKSKKSQE